MSQLKIQGNDALHLMADANALERLLRNLISNALKNTQAGGVRLHAMKRSKAARKRPRMGVPQSCPYETAVNSKRSRVCDSKRPAIKCDVAWFCKSAET